MKHVERLAHHYLKLAARRALKCGYLSLRLYDEAELNLRIDRRDYARAAISCPAASQQRCVYLEMVTAAELALNLLDSKRRRYVRRMVDRVFAAPQRVPERGMG